MGGGVYELDGGATIDASTLLTGYRASSEDNDLSIAAVPV
jgi:hypothetical protein